MTKAQEQLDWLERQGMLGKSRAMSEVCRARGWVEQVKYGDGSALWWDHDESRWLAGGGLQ